MKPWSQGVQARRDNDSDCKIEVVDLLGRFGIENHYTLDAIADLFFLSREGLLRLVKFEVTRGHLVVHCYLPDDDRDEQAVRQEAREICARLCSSFHISKE